MEQPNEVIKKYIDALVREFSFELILLVLALVISSVATLAVPGTSDTALADVIFNVGIAMLITRRILVARSNARGDRTSPPEDCR